MAASMALGDYRYILDSRPTGASRPSAGGPNVKNNNNNNNDNDEDEDEDMRMTMKMMMTMTMMTMTMTMMVLWGDFVLWSQGPAGV